MQKVDVVLLSILGFLTVVNAKPQGLDFLTFKDGKIGVNFGGYHAEAGLGGLLGGGRTAGGLHASAGTPWGANAQAGLGGILDGHGYTGGGLHASAGLGKGNPQAAAGIGGQVAGQGSQGGYYAGATTGNAPAPIVSQSEELKTYSLLRPGELGPNTPSQAYHSAPGVQVEKNIQTKFSEIQPDLSTRTVETQVFESVPSQPSVVSVEHHGDKQKTKITTKVVPSLQSGTVIEKIVHPGGNWTIRKYTGTQASASAVRHYHYTYPAVPIPGPPLPPLPPLSPPAPVPFTSYPGYAPSPAAAPVVEGGSNHVNYNTQSVPNPKLYDDIFNIPTSTLDAVNQLVKNKAA